MCDDEDNDGKFPDESLVEVRYPGSKQEEQGDRERWPWLPEWVGGGVYRWRGDYGFLEQGRRRCPHISSRLRRQTRLAKSRQHLVRDRTNRRSR